MEWKRYTEPSIGTYCCSQTAGRSRNDCLHDSTSSSIRSQVNTQRTSSDQVFEHLGDPTRDQSRYGNWPAHPLEPLSNILEVCGTSKLGKGAWAGELHVQQYPDEVLNTATG